MTALYVQEFPQPLHIAAAKSSYGHAEAGAGVLGLAASLTTMTIGSSNVLMHLHQMNLHVSSVFDAQCVQPAVPRQSSAHIYAGNTRRSGISGFAFQVRLMQLQVTIAHVCLVLHGLSEV